MSDADLTGSRALPLGQPAPAPARPRRADDALWFKACKELGFPVVIALLFWYGQRTDLAAERQLRAEQHAALVAAVRDLTAELHAGRVARP